MSAHLSVIIPTLNEESALSATLDHLRGCLGEHDEVIVVDGGSIDSTVKIAEDRKVRVLTAKKTGRAAQLDFGARLASGNYLCFLHADTQVPKNLTTIIDQTLSNKRVALAGFVSIMKGKNSLWLISLLNYVKTYLFPLIYRPYAFLFKGLRLLFGDQVMFCRREDYLEVGGFDPEMEIMEEADLCLKMNKLGRIKQVHHKVYSSDRRVAELGLWKALRIYIYVALGWVLGVPTDKLKSKYADIR